MRFELNKSRTERVKREREREEDRKRKQKQKSELKSDKKDTTTILRLLFRVVDNIELEYPAA